MRDLARRLDPGRVLLLSTIFFRLAFLRFLTKISIRKKRTENDVGEERAKLMITLVITWDQLSNTLSIFFSF